MSKLNKILLQWLPNDVHSLAWMAQNGVGSKQAQSWAWRYYKRGVLKKIGPGIYKRAHDTPHWLAVVRLLQEELGKSLHISGRTALELRGEAHHIPLAARPVVFLLSYDKKCSLPKWVRHTGAQCHFNFRNSSLFKPDFILAHKNTLLQTYQDAGGLHAPYSCRELAVLEFFDLVSFQNDFDFEDATNYLELLFGLRSDVLQILLENCKSIKTKRVFLYLSEKLNMSYFKHLNLNTIDLGTGKRQLVKGLVRFDKKYQITVPIPYTEFAA